MSDTTWEISHTHQRVGEECTCGGFRSAMSRDHWRHIAEATEAAVRSQIAADIRKAPPEVGMRILVTERRMAFRDGMERAARIAEGGTR